MQNIFFFLTIKEDHTKRMKQMCSYFLPPFLIQYHKTKI